MAKSKLQQDFHIPTDITDTRSLRSQTFQIQADN